MKNFISRPSVTEIFETVRNVRFFPDVAEPAFNLNVRLCSGDASFSGSDLVALDT